MQIFVIFTSILMLLYAAVMLLYRYWFIKLQPFIIDAAIVPATSFTVIIPARNEAENIANCLQSILLQNYPTNLFEIIVIDDFSTDGTPGIIQKLQTKHANLILIKLADVLIEKHLNSYKKKAIEIAIKSSQKNWIVTTDADCSAKPNWLATYNNYIQQNDVVFVGAPVVFTNDGSLLQSFQCIDFMALQGVTAATVSAGFHAMCNGANLAFKKAAFYEVDGYKNVDAIASGDDMFLMNKIQNKYPEKIGFLYHQDAIISTAPMPTINSFLNQRIRWASKTNNYSDIRIIIILWMMLLMNIALVIMPFAGISMPILLIYWLVLLAIKTVVEIAFAVKIAVFFSIKLQWWHVLLQLPHIVYTSLAGCFVLAGSYEWKGRKVK
ncbi:MAG: glycosyltransferase [Pedobacter sp.]|nr:glycosyltransferase [Chitinophagaceae bacterium]